MTIREIYKNSEQFLNKEVKLGGWIRSIRGSKHFGFLVLHDGTFFKPIQVVYEEKLENFQEISKMNVGAAVIVEGTLVPTPQAKQPFEIQAATVTLEGASAPDYPLQKKRHSLEYLRTISHLRPRTNTFQPALLFPPVRGKIMFLHHELLLFFCFLPHNYSGGFLSADSVWNGHNQGEMTFSDCLQLYRLKFRTGQIPGNPRW